MPRHELSALYGELAAAVDSLLAAHHGMRAHLRAGHPPLVAITEDGLAPMPLPVGLHHFGPGPMFDLWCECRAVEWVRFVWTGALTPGAPEPIPPPEIARAADQPVH